VSPTPIEPNEHILKNTTMNDENSISSELQAKIDALQDENLKANILAVLNGPGNQTITNEQIYENMVSRWTRVTAERDEWRKWTGEEVSAFVEYFKREIPDEFAEFLRQERENSQIDPDLSWRVDQLIDRLFPDLDYQDSTLLFGKFRDYVRTHLIG
jgi:uncharacterized membrane protein YdfJ with MMPL/SSD domain